eukprot:3014145-Prymnesium_polylepis.1
MSVRVRVPPPVCEVDMRDSFILRRTNGSTGIRPCAAPAAAHSGAGDDYSRLTTARTISPSAVPPPRGHFRKQCALPLTACGRGH